MTTFFRTYVKLCGNKTIAQMNKSCSHPHQLENRDKEKYIVLFPSNHPDTLIIMSQPESYTVELESVSRDYQSGEIIGPLHIPFYDCYNMYYN